jgi:dihydroorotate dehydrogenase (fumarate)
MDLSASYMGLKLQSPLVASSSPLTGDIDSLKKLEDAGASAVVLPSLFEEQIKHDADELEHYLHYGTERFAESLTYFPQHQHYKLGAEEYLEHISKARQALSIPVIASLNGVSLGSWSSYAQKIRQAGAHGIEINVYFLPTRWDLTSEDIEKVYLDALLAVKVDAAVPVAMKLSPYFSCLPSMARRLDQAGAGALVLFNRFYQPDIDPATLEVTPTLELSRSADNRLAQRWIAILCSHVRASLAATGGVHTGCDAAKMILAGADVVMLCSTLLLHGVEQINVIREELIQIMESHEYDSASQMKGAMSHRNCSEPAAYERANYIKVLNSFGQTATRE